MRSQVVTSEGLGAPAATLPSALHAHREASSGPGTRTLLPPRPVSTSQAGTEPRPPKKRVIKGEVGPAKSPRPPRWYKRLGGKI